MREPHGHTGKYVEKSSVKFPPLRKFLEAERKERRQSDGSPNDRITKLEVYFYKRIYLITDFPT